MRIEKMECELVSNKFTHNGETYDCRHLVDRDRETILREADDTHGGTFNKLYDRDSLEPFKAKLYTDTDGNIVYLMLVYHIKYREGTAKRLACGDYYPVFKRDESDLLLLPNAFQGSICW